MTLTAITKLKKRRSFLVVAPLRVIQSVWRQEAIKWRHTAHLKFSLIHGSPGQRLTAFAQKADIYLINYENLVWLASQLNMMAITDYTAVECKALSRLATIAKDKRGLRASVLRILNKENDIHDLFYVYATAAERDETLLRSLFSLVQRVTRRIPFDSIIFDEISKLKHADTKRFKAWRRIMPIFSRRWGLTGTPATNGYGDLWGQFFFLDNGKRLGRNVTAFRDQFMALKPFRDYQAWELVPGAEDEIHQLVADIVYEPDLSEEVNEPPLINDIWVDLPLHARQQYKAMEKEFAVAIQEREVVAANAAARSTKLLQMANGAVYGEDRKWTSVHNAKLEALDDVIEEAAGAPVLVAYAYRHDLARLTMRYPNLTPLTGNDVVARWNAGKVPLLALHPASAGHGLNLQEGGHILVWYGLPWNLEHYSQTIARLHGRLGQKARVTVHRLLARDTMDSVVADVLGQKAMTQDKLFLKIRKYLKNS